MGGETAKNRGPVCVGLLAHVDAGKTTLCEQLLFQSGAIRSAGRVDQRTALLDSGEMERERGITIFSDQATLSWAGREIILLDTPGHTDFSGEMERALGVMDCALLVVSAAEGVQSHTATLWRLLRQKNIPTLVFLNKIDRPGADPAAVLGQLRERLGAEGAFCWADPPDDPVMEGLAGLSEDWMARYFDGEANPDFWREAARTAFQAGQFFPVFTGAALQGEGISALLDGLSLLAPWPKGDPDAPFAGKVCRIRHTPAGRMAVVRVLEGRLRARQPVTLPDGSEIRAGALCTLQGGRRTPLEEAGPGMLCGVMGMAGTKPGDRIGEDAAPGGEPSLQPLLTARVLWDGEPALTVLGWLRELEEEEPLLQVGWEPELQEISIRVMGKIQLEVLAGLMAERYGLAIRFGRCRVLYRETLAAPVRGCGHFEPLRHYAEVHLLLSPGPRGSGIQFDSSCPADRLPASFQHLVRTHLMEREHPGVLTGMPVTDLRVTLLDGLYHLKHTEGGDFREATCRAIRQGLMSGQSVLLEPWYQFEIRVEPSLTGRILIDLQQMGGQCDPPRMEGLESILTGQVPAAGMMDYPAQFLSLTRGQGQLSLQPAGWFPCHNTDEVVAEIGYQPERDTANPAGSVFCSHGSGYLVDWREAPEKMHSQF